MGLNAMFSGLFAGAHQDLAVGMLVVVVGTINEFLGIRGRIFFMPVWLVGILILGRAAYVLWGWAGVIAPIAAIVLWLWWTVRSRRKKELHRWHYLPLALSALRAKRDTNDPAEFWRMVKESLFLPAMADYELEMRAHDLEVARIALEWLSKEPPSEESRKWSDLAMFLEQNQETREQVSIEFQPRKEILDVLEARLKSTEPTAMSIRSVPIEAKR